MTDLINNQLAIKQFLEYLAACRPWMQQLYQQKLAQDLSKQAWDGCFQRNVVAVMEETYAEAYQKLQTLAFDSRQAPIERGLSAISKQVLASFDGFVDEFLLFVVDKHRTSCALSNFPDEHKPDNLYINTVKRDIAKLWQNFALDVNTYILEH